MLNVDILVLPDAAASTVLGVYDVLASVGRDWELLTGRGEAKPRVRPRLVSPEAGELRVFNGVRLFIDTTLAYADDAEIILIPDLMLDGKVTMVNYCPEAVAWLQQRHQAGAVITTICSGSLLLAQTGLLAGQAATTHWGFVDLFRRQFPEVTLYPERILVASGEGERLITAGGATSWNDVVLYLIARFIGREQALQMAKLYLLQPHPEGQLPYACVSVQRQHEDALIGACQRWLAGHYDMPNPIAAMVKQSGLSETTFKRRFRAATGHSPMEYLQNLRVEEAKQMLESEGASIDVIAAAVGYEDTAFFRRLFKRRTALSPAVYRRKFHNLQRSCRTSET